MLKLTGDAAARYHTDQLVQTARKMLEAGSTIEDALDAVIEAAKREFGVRVVVSVPAQLLVDGGVFTWPEGERHV
jgi:hypothetical protein